MFLCPPSSFEKKWEKQERALEREKAEAKLREHRGLVLAFLRLDDLTLLEYDPSMPPPSGTPAAAMLDIPPTPQPTKAYHRNLISCAADS